MSSNSTQTIFDAASQSLAGRPVPVGAARGPALILSGLVTVYPSLLLRVLDEADKQAACIRFVESLRAVSALTAEGAGGASHAAAQ